MDEIEKILIEHVKPKSTVILAVSGGPDSIFLLTKCLNFQKTHPFKIIVAHVNHKLRGKESDKDEKLVQTCAKQNSLPFELKKLRKITNGNVEEICRNARYRFFEELRKKYRASLIITAHHRDDNIETILFNLIRGSYLEGITGMDIYAQDRKILRPLLNIPKKEILAHLNRRKVNYRTDKSNFDVRQSRNLLRHKIIPEMKKINPNFEKTFLKNVELFKETSQFIRQQSSNFLDRDGTGELDLFLSQPPIIQKNILNILYRRTHGNPDKFNQKHLGQILTMLNKRQTGLKKEFGDGRFITVARNKKNKRIIKLLSL